MGRLLIAEMKKMRSLHIWWLIIAGGILPEIITYLTLYKKDNIEWLDYTNMSLLSFNVQSLLTFAAFATFMWAREYEENTMELVLCYPFSRFCLVLVKLVILFFVVVVTTVLFFGITLIMGRGLFESLIPKELLWKLIIALLHTGILHFFMMPLYLCIAIFTEISISGLITGITNMCICLALSHTSLVQYIPPCIPYVIGDHQLGMKSLIVDHPLWVYDSILIGMFALSLIVLKNRLDKLK